MPGGTHKWAICQSLQLDQIIDKIKMLFLPTLFVLSGVLRGASVVESVPTFEYTKQDTGEVLVCDKCPPGTHMTARCTATTATRCAPCTAERFTELWNYLPRCLYCSTFCSEHQVVEKECSPLNSRVCRCEEGFYTNGNFCDRHSECEPGLGVQTRGTLQVNTVCEECSDGYFSNSSSALDTCVKHQECACGEIVLLPGSLYHDTVCGTCDDLANGGETLRTFMTGFFSMHRMRVAKMKKFVTRYIHKSVPRQRGPLMDQIRDWLLQVPEEKLRNLPEMLRTSTLTSMAEKLKRRLEWIKEQSPNCSLSL